MRNSGDSKQSMYLTDADIKKKKRNTLIVRTIIWIVIIVAAAICLMPFYSMIITSTHQNSEIARKLLLVPGEEFMDNYNRLVEVVPIWRGFLNSLFITIVSTILGLYFSALSGYGFSKYPFKGNGILFAAVLATMMVPGQLGIIGFFRLVNEMGLLNTYWPIILPSISNAFALFFFKQVADNTVPHALLESGRIDGARELAIFHKIGLPLMGPSLATMGIFQFIGKWNEFLQPMILLFDQKLQTLPVLIASVRSQFNVDYGAQYVGIVISIIPIMIVFAIFSKQIIGNVMAGAVKE